MNITKDINYMEGQWAAKSMIKTIANTTYETIENAIAVKQALIDNFETKFGYTRDMPEFDYNYSYNSGLLDALKEHHESSKI